MENDWRWKLKNAWFESCFKSSKYHIFKVSYHLPRFRFTLPWSSPRMIHHISNFPQIRNFRYIPLITQNHESCHFLLINFSQNTGWRNGWRLAHEKRCSGYIRGVKKFFSICVGFNESVFELCESRSCWRDRLGIVLSCISWSKLFSLYYRNLFLCKLVEELAGVDW